MASPEEAPAPATAPAPAASASDATRLPDQHQAVHKPEPVMSEPLSSKLASLVSKFRQLLKGKKSGAPAAAGAPAAGTTPAADTAAPKDASASAAEEPPVPAHAEGPLAAVNEAVHKHEPAEALQEPVPPVQQVKNAVVSTVEHVVDEAAAVGASLSDAVKDELAKMTHEVHEAQTHPQDPPQPPTTALAPA
ncbi:hypothetical protein HYH03_006333 [Edaphochlamys debaryana]|uniref:Uncharacterized protein n=1 Tax=Edaphochlamys debaryana TaxID=47281 RepID=A0A835Y454_9CHLO|nr:hypothetical protein HYH03_006333 [Edaphochlamys debaryana]|eukprot:KAG2495735.1 hypothetical protein HYH03_006333 [Edaphochlamys debaryana]